MSEPERVSEPIEVEVNTEEERERRQQPERKEIESGSELDWRSYGRRSIPSRWRA